MFYSQFILAKKGPLGTIWIAAHLERKLRKNQVADTDIGDSVDSILFPDVPIALRLSSHLLLGVVRIFSKVDLPPEESTAPYHSITYPRLLILTTLSCPTMRFFRVTTLITMLAQEQITLQDTMGDMVYSTSQFGLDERFGDGDTSQMVFLMSYHYKKIIILYTEVGVKTPQELVLDQVAVPGSVEVSEYDQGSDVPQKQDPSNLEAVPMDCSGDQIFSSSTQQASQFPLSLAANSGFVEIDEDVGTPGLEEVPSLSGVHKALADHLESENHNLTENECVENAPNNKSKFLNGDNGPMDQSLHNAINRDAIVHVPPENGCHISDMEKEQTKPQGNSINDALSVECTSVVGTIKGSDGLDKVEDMDNGAMHSMDRTDGECAESPSCYNVTFDLEDHSRRTCSSSIYVRASDGCLENGQASHKCEIGNCAQTTDNLEEPCSPAIAIASDPSCPLEPPSRPTVIDGEAQACQERYGSENLKNPIVDKDVSSLQVLGSDSLAAAKQNLVDLSGREEEVRAPRGSIEVQVEACQIRMSEPALCDDRLDNSNNCATSDLPAPEKLLSAAEGPLDKPSDMLGNSTPDKEVLVENDEIDAGTKHISGKKRSLTESTLTIESINSVESFGRPGSRRTTDSVPDDDDLLSSILVGRSSVFKMKPTPPLEVASTKRARSAPSSHVTKRKVLMDDTMVLHGDTIRKQLVNTEDMRRIRKKAPCTRPEISLIQRKFLEDEIFSEPIFTGISGDLASLHSESYDLSSIRISEGEENHASSEVAKNPECLVKPNIAEGGTEGSFVPVILGNDKQARSSGTLNAQQDSYAVDDVPQLLQHEPLGGITEMEIDGVNIEVANAANHSILNEFRVSSPTDLVTGDTSNITAEEVTNTIDGSILNNVTCLLPDQKMNTQPGEDASELDMRNGKVSHPTEVLEHDVEGIIATETESKATDELLLEESKTNTSVEVSMEDYPAPVGNGTIQTGVSVNYAQNAYESGCGKAGVADEVQVQDALLDHDDKDTICKDSKECKLNYTYSEKVDTALKNASLLDGETPTSQEIDAVNEEMISLADNRAEREDVAVVNDTEFLNVDDNELGDDDEDDMSCGDKGHLLENSGWSSRTRAVAKYLQNLFEDEAVNGQKVLKTRDYIHVEQVKPFDNICIKPRVKLMKSSF
ncbi:Sister chromatid cohesion 1 protein 4, putative isoform 4 [Hibiscus syriacus]|uniref:Sister chromatid cohesion 1 protein 4, putative isoform 4 n=1 Tax=Hibiscus syriacus TaxID=106335 RepID=A0A6A2XBU9_HIBSY|nr:Sister chromatid cohesion 1 protein 4, putative isoform 4 [Hibiscus syriacus]